VFGFNQILLSIVRYVRGKLNDETLPPRLCL
jgi:hypothetical protein